MLMASRDAQTPTVIEMRVPQTTSAKMSRPRLSVPNQCSVLGGCRTSLVKPLGYGASSGAASPTSSSASISASAATPMGLVRNAYQVAPPALSCAATGSVSSSVRTMLLMRSSLGGRAARRPGR